MEAIGKFTNGESECYDYEEMSGYVFISINNIVHKVCVKNPSGLKAFTIYTDGRFLHFNYSQFQNKV